MTVSPRNDRPPLRQYLLAEIMVQDPLLTVAEAERRLQRLLPSPPPTVPSTERRPYPAAPRRGAGYEMCRCRAA